MLHCQALLKLLTIICINGVFFFFSMSVHGSVLPVIKTSKQLSNTERKTMGKRNPFGLQVNYAKVRTINLTKEEIEIGYLVFTLRVRELSFALVSFVVPSQQRLSAFMAF